MGGSQSYATTKEFESPQAVAIDWWAYTYCTANFPLARGSVVADSPDRCHDHQQALRIGARCPPDTRMAGPLYAASDAPASAGAQGHAGRRIPAAARARRRRPRPFRGDPSIPHGNGRVGRLLITLLLVARDVLPSPLLYLSAYFEATREACYAHLLAMTEQGAWEEWLIYFLQGVALQSEDAVRRIEQIDELLARWRRELSGSRSRLAERALDLLAENPFWTVGGVAERLGVAFTTAQRGIDRLEEAGIVARVGEARRNRVHCAEAILTVLEQPLSLRGASSATTA